MGMLEPILAQLLVEGFMPRPEKRSSGFRKAGYGFVALAGLLAAAGTVYLLIATNAYLETIYVSGISALLTAGTAFILSAICFLVYKIADGAKKPVLQSKSNVSPAVDALMTILDEATQGLEKPIADNPRVSVALASLAGFMAGNKLH